jgi:hypothetical protein
MKRVVIDELLPGMVLAKSVTNTAGLPVVAAGAELDRSMIDRLQQLGLTLVYVEGDAGDTTGKTLAELEAELEHRFRRVLQDSLQALILRQIRDHLRATHGLQEQGGRASL